LEGRRTAMPRTSSGEPPRPGLSTTLSGRPSHAAASQWLADSRSCH